MKYMILHYPTSLSISFGSKSPLHLHLYLFSAVFIVVKIILNDY
jgi:hypothetical protein